MRPGLFYNEYLGTNDPLATVLFAGLWCLADREGRFEWRLQQLRAKIFPYREVDMSYLMQILIVGEQIARYQHGGDDFGLVLKFRKHQSINRNEAASALPPPPPDILNAYACTCKEMHDCSRSLLEVEVEVEQEGESEGGIAPGVRPYQTPDARGNPRFSHPRFPKLWFSELELSSLYKKFERAGLRADFQDQAFVNVEQWFTDTGKGRREYPKSSNHMRRVSSWGLSEALRLQRESDYAKVATARAK